MKELKKLVESVLSEDTNLGIVGVPSILQKEYQTSEENTELEEKKDLDIFCVEVNGKSVWEGSAKDKKEALTKAEDEEGVDKFEGKVTVYKKEKIEEEEEVKLSPDQFRTLFNMSIAEQMINESVGGDPELEAKGFVTDKKLTPKAKLILKKYLPTIFAS